MSGIEDGLRGCKKITSGFQVRAFPMVRGMVSQRSSSSTSAVWERALPHAEVPQCQCLHGQPAAEPLHRARHQHLHGLLSRLNDQQRRWSAAVEATRLGHGGDPLVAHITRLDSNTLQRGRQALAEALAACPTARVRLPGAGRPRVDKQPPSWHPHGWSVSRRKRPAIRGVHGRGCAVVCTSGVSAWLTWGMPRGRRRSAGG
jgi:hypothetical protein